jgi:hypothetical protein
VQSRHGIIAALVLIYPGGLYLQALGEFIHGEDIGW